MIKKQIEQKQFNQPINGTDPITKGHFTIDWAFVIYGMDYTNMDTTREETLSAVGQISIDGYDNPFYTALVKTPLLIQDHPLCVNFVDEMRFIKIVEIGKWEHIADYTKISLSNVVFEFLDNLDYLETVQDFKDSNLL